MHQTDVQIEQKIQEHKDRIVYWQNYKALNQLERLQRLRAGETVPPPLEVDVAVSGVDGA